MYKYKSVIIILILLLCVGMVGGLFNGGGSSSGGSGPVNKIPSKDPTEDTTKEPTEPTTQAPKETTTAPDPEDTEAPKETTAAPETTDIEIDVPEVDTDWYAFIDSFMLISDDGVVNINNASTDSVNGSIIRNGETTYSSVTASGVAFVKGWVAFDGAEVSGMNVKVYDQGGSQLGSPISIVLADADETVVNAVAALGYSDGTVARKISFENYKIIDLVSLADEGQTVTVVYEITLAGSDDTVEVISLDVTIPESAEAPEDTTEASKEVGNWGAYVYEFYYGSEPSADDEVLVENVGTDNENGNTLYDCSTITANVIFLCDADVAVEGFEISGMNAKIYAANGTLLDTVEGCVEVNDKDYARDFGYVDTTTYNVYDDDYIDLTAYAGQTVTVVYEFALIDSEYTVEGIKIDVIVPESAEAPEVDVFALEPGLYSAELDTTTPVISWDSLVEQGAVVVTDGSVTPVASLLPAGNLVLPNDGSVTTIGASAFANCESLVGILIPDAVTSIGDRAFENCTNLENVIIGNGVTSIGVYAFNCCSALETVKMSSGSFGLGTFNGCNAIKTFDLSGCTSVLSIMSEYYPPVFGSSTIYVPADLYDEWIAAEHWSDIADRIVAVEN